MSVHHTFKRILRLFIASCIFLATLAFLLTSFIKGNELLNAENALKNKTSVSYSSRPGEQYILLSNNQKPDQSVLVLLEDKGYVAKVDCEHYADTLCLDAYNFFTTRHINNVTLEQIGAYKYFKSLTWIDTKTNQPSDKQWSDAQVAEYYHADITQLKYELATIVIFTLIALYCSYRLIRNFRQYLDR